MKILFFMWSFFAVLWEAICIVSPHMVSEFKKGVRSKKSFNDQSKTGKAFGWFNALYAGWIFVGLFSSQWVLFVIVFFLGVVPKRNTFFVFIDSFLTLPVLIFIIINAFHLHLDLLQIILGWLK